MKPKAVHWHCQSWVCRRKEKYWEILSSFLLKNKHFVLFFCHLDFELLSIHPELTLALGQVWRKTRSFRHMPHHSSILKMLNQGDVIFELTWVCCQLLCPDQTTTSVVGFSTSNFFFLILPSVLAWYTEGPWCYNVAASATSLVTGPIQVGKKGASVLMELFPL